MSGFPENEGFELAELDSDIEGIYIYFKSGYKELLNILNKKDSPITIEHELGDDPNAVEFNCYDEEGNLGVNGQIYGTKVIFGPDNSHIDSYNGVSVMDTIEKYLGKPGALLITDEAVDSSPLFIEGFKPSIQYFKNQGLNFVMLADENIIGYHIDGKTTKLKTEYSIADILD